MGNQEVQKQSGLQIEKIEMGSDLEGFDRSVFVISTMTLMCFLFTVASFQSEIMFFVYLFAFFGLIGVSIVSVILLLLAQRRRIRKGLPVRPTKFLLSRAEIFHETVCVLTEHVNVLIERWNRYCDLKDAGYTDPLLNEVQMYQWLLELREETQRHVNATKAIVAMEKAGDFRRQTTSNDAIGETLGQVRMFEDQLRRCFDGVEHRLHTPLAITANVRALEQEMAKDMEAASDQLARSRAATAAKQRTTGP